MVISDKKFSRNLALGVALIWGLAVVLSCLYETRAPSTDVFLFKEAGVNLAESGALVASHLSHMDFGESRPYAYYPPLYPAIYGLWSSVAGVGLKQSILFDALLRLVRTLLLFALFLPAWRLHWRSRGARVGVSVLFLLLSFVSSDGDRPDELAVIFGLLSFYYLCKCRWWVAGFTLGLTGATSPVGGMFFALLATYKLVSTGRVKACLQLGSIAAGVFALCNLPVYLADPDAFVRFAKQASLSNFPYSLSSLTDFLSSFARSLEHSWRSGWAYVVSAALLATTSTLLYLQQRADARFGNRSGYLLAMSVVFTVANAIIWTLQPYYLWFPILGFTAYLFASSTLVFRRVLLMLFVALLPLLFREFKGQISAFQRSPAQSASYVADQVLAQVRPTDRLAVSADQFFTFRGKHAVANVNYVCPYIKAFDYVYVTPKSSRRDRPERPTFPCLAHRACFDVVLDLTPAPVFTVLGVQTPYYVRGNGGVLFRNAKCPAYQPLVGRLN